LIRDLRYYYCWISSVPEAVGLVSEEQPHFVAVAAAVAAVDVGDSNTS
jgi:hypothetical protein